MRYDLIIKNGTIVTPEKSFIGGAAVLNGKIAALGTIDPRDTAAEIYDALGLHILPGIIDAHAHFRDPGLTDKEDFETGSAAAVMGGVTTVADMPNTVPVTFTVELFNEKIKIAREKSYADFALFALLTNDNINEIEGLINAGALGFKVFYGTSTGDIAAPSAKVLTRHLAKCPLRTGFHAESNDINANFTEIAKRETDAPDGFWLDYARPVISELQAIHEIISLARDKKIKIHFHHITSFDAVALVSEARQNGYDISTEVCPHHLLFDAENFTHKVYPPIRDESHRTSLWESIKNGNIDMIASDHAPHTAREKEAAGWGAPAGLSGVETSAPLMLTKVNNGAISVNDYARLASEAPAKIWGLYPRKGNINPGSDADFTIVDMNAKKIIKASELHSKSKVSPYEGMEVKGLPVATIIRGKFVMRNGELTGKKGYGEFVTPLVPS